MEAPDEYRHDRHVAEERDQPVEQVEAPQPQRALASRRGAIAPGPPLVPQEVVQDRGFYRHHGGGQVGHTGAKQGRQDAQLDAESHHADRVEDEPPPHLTVKACDSR